MTEDFKVGDRLILDLPYSRWQRLKRLWFRLTRKLWPRHRAPVLTHGQPLLIYHDGELLKVWHGGIGDAQVWLERYMENHPSPPYYAEKAHPIPLPHGVIIVDPTSPPHDRRPD